MYVEIHLVPEDSKNNIQKINSDKDTHLMKEIKIQISKNATQFCVPTKM